MSHRGPSAVPIVLSEEERTELLRRARGPGRWRADRARIILACGEGMSNARAARELGVAVKSASKWRRQFTAERLAGLEDAAPVGRRWRARARLGRQVALDRSPIVPGLPGDLGPPGSGLGQGPKGRAVPSMPSARGSWAAILRSGWFVLTGRRRAPSCQRLKTASAGSTCEGVRGHLRALGGLRTDEIARAFLVPRADHEAPGSRSSQGVRFKRAWPCSRSAGTDT